MVPKGKTKEEETGGGRPCLMMITEQRTPFFGKALHTHHHENQTQTPGPFREGDVTSLYGGGGTGGIGCDAADKTRASVIK
jgi:hypothetical protein